MIRSFDGKSPRIAQSAFVSEAAYVIGDVEVGEGSNIWPGAVVRGDSARISIGQNTDVEDGAILHGDGQMDIGDNVIIGHGAMVHGRRVGSNSLIGINATILTGVEVGEGCLVAAGSVVREQARIPDGAFVAGVPGQQLGEVPEEQRQRLVERHFRFYTPLAKKYKKEGL